MSRYLPVSNMPSKLGPHRNSHSDKGSDLEGREEGRGEFKLKQLEDKLELNSQETGHFISARGPVQVVD